jgi:hypothetical protein
VWLLVDPRTPDLAGAVYRVGLFRHIGLGVVDESWYAGHHVPGYSLLFPPLGALLGVRALGALSVLASTGLFARLAGSIYGRGAGWGTAWFAVAALGDVWAGRVAFALGVAFAFAAALAFAREHPLLGVLLAALCAAASPVAGALLGLGALTVALATRSPRALLCLAVPPAAVVLVLALLFPEGGWEPYPIVSFAATALVVLAFLLALPSSARVPALGGWLYLLACVAFLLVHSPMGSNIERYGVLLAGPLLLCARFAPATVGGSPARSGEGSGEARSGEGAREAGSGEVSGEARLSARLGALRGSTPALVLALCAIAVWVIWGPVRETVAVAGSPATSASYYAPLERFLAGRGSRPVRVEVPLTRSHWEAALLAPSVALARGWEKQLEDRYDRVLQVPGLTAARYERWLGEQAVGYVALPDVALDPSSAQEGRLIAGGLAYLREVFASAHWRVYRVLGATPLATGPGRLSALGHDSFTLEASSAGSFLVRVHFTPYWTLTRGSGCVSEAPGGWTAVRLDGAGPAVVSARFSLSRALGSGSSCAQGGSG